ncbi:vWA domain-containing protein [Pragia fontium]|uniref:vWA domain-containing protein n=1 Tax=Pragia fontium TaxID=82985 RepID=UPI000649E23D|nr:RNA-binding protein [Pragia fontium]AKJ42429.1 RNA-binding protein [Pragia fontium]
MANNQLFKSLMGRLLPKADAINEAGGTAYQFSATHALAQYAATGCLNGTYYASAETQLEKVLELCAQVEPLMLAKIAVYCREYGYMKDMPALLLASLSLNGTEYLSAAFPRVVDNGKMLRNFVQILRSGVVGRKSLGTRPKKLVQNWLNTASEQALLSAAVGNAPSLADVVKMVHPKPEESWREAFFAWLIGKPYNEAQLPPATRAFEQYKRTSQSENGELPAVPFQMLTSLALTIEDWAQIARQGSWQMVRMNLNTFARHGVFELPGIAEEIAAKLRDRNNIARAKVFPYQLMTAYQAVNQSIPLVIREALQDALEIALENVPAINGKVVVCPDVSGSMHSSITGYRQGATSVTRCVDVAGLIAATYLRKQRDTLVLPFEFSVVGADRVGLNPRDTVLTNAAKLAAACGGGTDCSAPLKWLNDKNIQADLVLLVSDNESWMNVNRYGDKATETMRQWDRFKQRNPQAKLVCLDMQPYATSQAQERDDILNIGGFSDVVFKMITAFAHGQMQSEHWIGEINKVTLSQ